jgi:type VI secretion system protein ImpA
LELRATPLRWVATQLDSAVRSAPLTTAGHNWYQYKESRGIPSEEDARMDPTKQQRRQEALDEGALPPEEFEKGFEATPAEFSQKIHDDLGALIERVEQLSVLSDEKFGDASPDFGPLRKTLEEVHVTARMLLAKKGGPRQAEPEPGGELLTEPEFEAAPAGEPPATASRPRRRSTAGIEPADENDAADRLAAVARFLRQQNPLAATPYLIPRAFRWGELRTAGAYPDPMFLVAPPSQVRMDLKRLALEGSWEQLREVAEEAAGQPWSRAWLDLQRYAVNACRYTGADAAALAIIAELKALLADFPQLPTWTLADDTPSANAETQQWLKDEGIVAPPPQAEAPPAPIEWTPPPMETPRNGGGESNAQVPAPPDAYELAMEAARNGRLDEAMHILSEEVAQAQSGRGRFLRRVQLAQICLACGNDEIGRPILEELAAEIERRGLESWENMDLIAQPLALLYRSMGNSEETEMEKRKLYARICRLDPARALSLHR